MAFDAFMKIASIPGESSDEKHKDWIELESFSWGISNGAITGSRPSSDRRVVATVLSLCKSVDSSTPLMAKACGDAELLAEVKIEVCRATKAKEKYLEYTIGDAFISNFTTQATAGGALPVDLIEIVMASLRVEYIQTDLKTGRVRGSSEYELDFRRPGS